MGAGLLTLAPFIPPVGLVNPKPPISPNYKPLSKVRCSSTRAGSGSRQPWDSNGETIRSERFKFNGGYEFSGDGDGSIGFRSNEKRRKWWSDYASEINEEDEDDDEDDEEFGLWEESRGVYWIFKVFKAFGWLLPAIVISLLLGTGPNALIMALALPLGQSALSSVIYKLWGSRGFNPSRVPRSRDEPFVRKTTDRSESTRQGSMGSRRERKSYRSWVAGDGGSAKKDGGSGLNFGGWDELDKQAAVDGNDFTRNGRTESHDKLPRRPMNGKLSRRRSREKPLYLRLLTVVFPFLGSWTRFFM